MSFFAFLFLSSLGLLVFGIFSPKTLKPVVREVWSRGKIASVFGAAAIFSFVGVGMTAPPIVTDPGIGSVVEQSAPVVPAVSNTPKDKEEEKAVPAVEETPQEEQATSVITPKEEPETAPVVIPIKAPVESIVAPLVIEPAADVPASSGTNYYTNVDNQAIESPSANTNGATGVCNDGSYTHATHHSGACSHHGGVNYWL